MKLPRLAAGVIAAASTVYAAHNITVLANSTSIAYSGTSSNAWNSFTNCGGSEYTYQTEQFFSFNFVGTGVYVVGTGSQEGGVITFNLDGVSTEYDRYSTPPYKCGQMMFAKGGLDNGSHTLTATFTGKSSENSTANAFFEYQYIQYTQTDLTDSTSTASPTSTSGSTTGTASGVPTQTGSGGSKVNAGAIGGGIAAGVIGLAIIGFILWYCVRRNKETKAQEAAAANRHDLDPPRQSFMYSPVGVSGYGRLSHEGTPRPGPPAEHRSSMSIRGAPGTVSSPWTPDAQLAANLAPSDSATVSGTHAHYPPGAAAPSVVHSSSQSSGSSPVRSYSTGFAVQNPGQQQSMMGTGALPESEVERIAARVASMMHPGQQQPQPQPQQHQLPPGAAAPTKGGASSSVQRAPQDDSYDQPPPMYEPRQDP